MNQTPCRTADPIDDRAANRLRDWAKRALWVVLGALFLIGVSIAGLLTGARQTATYLRLLGTPAPAQQGPEEAYWGPALADAEGDLPFATAANALCDVQSQHYVSGKNGGWRTDARRTRVNNRPTATLADGRLVVLADDARFEPLEAGQPSDGDARNYRGWYHGFSGPRMLAQCLQEGPIYVDGCIHPSADGGPPMLGGCRADADARPLVLTQGGRGKRLAEASQAAAGTLLFVALGVLLTLLALAGRARGRSAETSLTSAWSVSPEGMRQRAANEGKKHWKENLALAALALPFWGLQAVTQVSTAVAWAATATTALTLGAYYTWRKRAALLPLLRTIEAVPTAALAAAEGDQVELQVQVARNAPVTRAPLSGDPNAAHVSLQVWRRVVVKSGRNTTVEYPFVFSKVLFGDKLPVEDASGQGVLELGDAFLDFPARQVLAFGGQGIPMAVHQIVPMHDGDYLVRESVLHPGAPLYALGPVKRELSATAQVTYRGVPTRARVAADDGSAHAHLPLFVHAGTERGLLETLRNGIRRETTFAALLAGSYAVFTLLLGAIALSSLLP